MDDLPGTAYSPLPEMQCGSYAGAAGTMTNRIGLYGSIRWDGAPFLDASGALIQQVVNDHARWPVVILEAYALLQRPDIAAALRAANPALRLIAFMDLEKVHASPHTMDAATDLRYEYYAALAANNGVLWSAKDGQPFDPLNPPGARKPWSQFAANLASPAAVRAISDVLVRRVHGSGLFDGVMLDWAAHSVARASTLAGDEIDYDRAGFVTGKLPEDAKLRFDLTYREGHRLFFRRIAEAAPDDFSICFNSQASDPLESAHVWGQMNENFPTNPGDTHDWLKVMQEIWAREARRSPDRRENWICSLNDGPGELAFGLASACMTDSARFTIPAMNGRPEPDGRERIWSPLYELELGAPLGRAERIIGASGLWIRRFERGIVTVEPALRRGTFYEVRP